MQKSRWCKGGMQIFFSHHNAIFHKNISFMQKILWNTSGLAYISATVTTPVFLVSPLTCSSPQLRRAQQRPAAPGTSSSPDLAASRLNVLSTEVPAALSLLLACASKLTAW